MKFIDGKKTYAGIAIMVLCFGLEMIIKEPSAELTNLLNAGELFGAGLGTAGLAHKVQKVIALLKQIKG